MSETKSPKTAVKAPEGQKAEVAAKAPAQRAVVKPLKTAPARNAKAPAVPLMLDRMLWLASLLIIAAAIGGNYYYVQHFVIDESSLGRLLRIIAVIVAIVVGLGVILFTNKGRTLISFARESYIELRKVVWPTRQEAMQTTFIVFVAVCLVSVVLYLCDVVFLQVVRAITL